MDDESVRAEIEDRLATIQSDANDANIPLVETILEQPDDRWYGRLTVAVANGVSAEDDTHHAIPAATSVELLRGYIRLRSQLLVSLTEHHAHSQTFNPDSALLAGDYLHSAAYSSLDAVPNACSAECFELVTTAGSTITKLFAQSIPPNDSNIDSYARLVDEIASQFGETAAALGATIAGAAELNRQQFERLGSELGADRELHRVLSSTTTDAIIVPPTVDENRLRDRAEQRRTNTDRLLEYMSHNSDSRRFQPLFKLYDTTYNQ